MLQRNILIVEDEIMIANLLQYHLELNGYTCVGIAMTYEEAITLLDANTIHLVLLDINIYGQKTGVDLGNLLNSTYKIPFIYISSYSDKQTIDDIKDTFPVSYFIKPINYKNLLIEIELFFYKTEIADMPNYVLQIGKESYSFNLDNLVLAKAEHVYVELIFIHKKLLLRTPLKSILQLLPHNFLVQVNRSIAVNPNYILKIKSNNIITNYGEYKITRLYKANF